jgi:hypothetical protein
VRAHHTLQVGQRSRRKAAQAGGVGGEEKIGGLVAHGVRAGLLQRGVRLFVSAAFRQRTPGRCHVGAPRRAGGLLRGDRSGWALGVVRDREARAAQAKREPASVTIRYRIKGGLWHKVRHCLGGGGRR